LIGVTMPALEWAGRRWPISDDDFVGFGLAGVLMRCGYVGYVVYACLELRGAHTSADGAEGGRYVSAECVLELRAFVLVAIGIGTALLLINGALGLSSARGVVWQHAQRRAVGPLLTAHVALVGVEAVWLGCGLLLPGHFLAGCARGGGASDEARALYAAAIGWLALLTTLTPAWLLSLFSLSRDKNALAHDHEAWWGSLFARVCGCCVRGASEEVFVSVGRLLVVLLGTHGAEHAVLSDLVVGALLLKDAQERGDAAACAPTGGAADARGADAWPRFGRGWARLRGREAARRVISRVAELQPRKFYTYGAGRAGRAESAGAADGADGGGGDHGRDGGVDVEANELCEAPAVREAAHFMRFALAVYGIPMAAWVGDGATVRESVCGGGCCCCCLPCRCAGARAPASPVRRHEIAFVRMAQIARGDVLASDWARRFRPAGACAYAVCVDRAARAVVVVVRGTLDMGDALTDVCAETIDAVALRVGVAADQPYAVATAAAAAAAAASESDDDDGGARAAQPRSPRAAPSAAPAVGAAASELDPEWVSHRGILESAHELYDELSKRGVLETLRAQLQDSTGLLRGFELVVTGHSLGAGVATLLTLLLRARGFVRARCFAFSPPPLLPRAAAAAAAACVLTVAVDGDAVPRLSLVSVHRLAAQIVDELRRAQAAKWLIWARFWLRALASALGCAPTATPLGAPAGALWRCARASGRGERGRQLLSARADGSAPSEAPAVRGAEAAIGLTPLYLAGRVMLLEADGDETDQYSALPCLPASATRHKAMWVDASEFQELRIANSLIDHLPDRMARILDELAADVGGGAPAAAAAVAAGANAAERSHAAR
jgi:hypothetical protein